LGVGRSDRTAVPSGASGNLLAPLDVASLLFVLLFEYSERSRPVPTVLGVNQVVFLCDCDKLLLVDGRVVLVLKTLNLRFEPFLRLALELFGTVCLLLNAVSLLLYLLADGIGYVCVVLLVLRQSSAEPLGNVVLGKLIQLVFALFNLFGQILNLRQSLFKFLVLVLI